MDEGSRGPLKLRFLGSLVEQLGAQLYPGATATIAELISNAWDADARNVWIEIPLDRPWTEDERIVVTDDGVGMSYADAEKRYLLVGRKRRVELAQDRTDGGRPLHGRKGIGKLAAFGTAKTLECLTVGADGEVTNFRLDYDRIRDLEPTEDYKVEPAQEDGVLRDAEGNSLAHGTRITLAVLRPRRSMNEAQFRRSLARRFALDTNEMKQLAAGGRWSCPGAPSAGGSASPRSHFERRSCRVCRCSPAGRWCRDRSSFSTPLARRDSSGRNT